MSRFVPGVSPVNIAPFISPRNWLKLRHYRKGRWRASRQGVIYPKGETERQTEIRDQQLDRLLDIGYPSRMETVGAWAPRLSLAARAERCFNPGNADFISRQH